MYRVVNAKFASLFLVCAATFCLYPGCTGVERDIDVEAGMKIGQTPLVTFHLKVKLGPPEVELPVDSVYKGKVTVEEREYNVFVAPDGSVWVEINGKYQKIEDGDLPPEIRRLLNGPQQAPPTEQEVSTGDSADPVQSKAHSLTGSCEFDTAADHAVFEVTTEVDPGYDPTPIEGNFNVVIDVQHHGDGTGTIRLEGTINGVLSGAMLIGVERVHDPYSEWGDVEVILNYDWSMAFIDLDGEPYTEIVLYEGQ